MSEYQKGFNSKGELWIGLDQLHEVTSSGKWRLDVVMGDWKDKNYTARYNEFSVGSKGTGYALTIGLFDGDASTLGDSMITTSPGDNQNGMKFSTKDVDNDMVVDKSCSTAYGGSGGWWYNRCYVSNPNGGENRKDASWKGIVWYDRGDLGTSWNAWKSSELSITQIA